MKHRIITAILAAAALTGSAQVLQPVGRDGRSYTPVRWDSIWLATASPEGLFTVHATGGHAPLTIDPERSIIHNGATAPLITITTDEHLEFIPDKVNYKSADLSLRGLGVHDDVMTRVNIRGRGNSSWTTNGKQPYRLKFDKKVKLCGLNTAKNYVLLAGWTDYSLTQNVAASIVADMLGLPYVNRMVPVDVILNGTYRGAYLLTNKPGINSGSVDIDEDTSVMWELDTYYDEEMKFRSPIYNLPVMLSDPDMSEERFEEWKADFIAMEQAVADGDARDHIDIDLYAAYRSVYEIMMNNELQHPKSVKLYKTEGGRYCFGPVWDFDWMTGFTTERPYAPEVATRPPVECSFFKAINASVGVKAKLKEKVVSFLDREDEFWKRLNAHITLARTSNLRNDLRWPAHAPSADYLAQYINVLHLHFDYLRRVYNHPL